MTTNLGSCLVFQSSILGSINFSHIQIHEYQVFRCAIHGFLFQILYVVHSAFRGHRHSCVASYTDMHYVLYMVAPHDLPISFFSGTYGMKCTCWKIKTAFYLKVLEKYLLKSTVFYMNVRACKNGFSVSYTVSVLPKNQYLYNTHCFYLIYSLDS